MSKCDYSYYKHMTGMKKSFYFIFRWNTVEMGGSLLFIMIMDIIHYVYNRFFTFLTNYFKIYL